jgi:hypothetical protein
MRQSESSTKVSGNASVGVVGLGGTRYIKTTDMQRLFMEGVGVQVFFFYGPLSFLDGVSEYTKRQECLLIEGSRGAGVNVVSSPLCIYLCISALHLSLYLCISIPYISHENAD